MNYFSETLTGGIHHILYGVLKPQRVLKRYESYRSDNDLYHHLKDFPESPDAYMSVHGDIYSRWTSHITDDSGGNELNHWRPPFYVTSPNLPESFHTLCDFYRTYIRAECRMMIEASEYLKESADVEMFTLRYELLTLRDELLELIRETNSGIDKDCPDSLSCNLNTFVLTLLRNHLFTTFFELQIRSEHLLDGRAISKRELYLDYLSRPMPEHRDLHRTPALTCFELELASRSEDTGKQLASVEALLSTVRSEGTVGRFDLIQDSINLLENCWFCLFVKTKTERWKEIDLNSPEQCACAIEQMKHRLFDPTEDRDERNDRPIIQAVIQHIGKIRSIIQLTSENEISASARLAASVERYYSRNNKPEAGSGIDPQISPAPMVQESSRASVLDEYILVDELKEKLGVTQKSLNAYLSDSKTPVHKFSNKTKLIHISDLAHMMDHFKTTM